MRSSPHQMNIGCLVFNRIRNAVRKLCGQVSGFPSELADQSYARVSAPISPPPARKSAEAGLLIFNIRTIGTAFCPDWQPELNRLSQARQTLSPCIWFRFIFQGWNKM